MNMPMRTTLAALSMVACGALLLSAQGQPAAQAARQPAAQAARQPTAQAVGQPAGRAEAPILRVQKSVYMVAASVASTSGNVTVQVGDDGVVLVDTGTTVLAPQVLSAIRMVSSAPIHTIVNSHLHPDHTGGNEMLIKLRGAQAVRVMGHENTFNRMIDAAAAANSNITRAALPTNTYFTPTRDFHVNGEAIVLYHVPAAITDGDTVVHFRGSDVVSTGDVFTPDRYPAIDLQSGGTVNGVIAALNRVLEITVPAKNQEGGTYVVPGHGRLCDEADVVEYRDMVTIVRDRIQDMLRKKMTLQQVKAARPSRDYDGEYGAPDGFVEATFRSLGGK
jgi:glyoxylase-like metal-dependent hydrolase (beta-lactamase superfamily II)